MLFLVAERSYLQIILTRQTVRTCMCVCVLLVVCVCVCVCPTQTSKIFLLFPCTTPYRCVVPPFKRLSSPQKLISIFYLLQFFDFAFSCSRLVLVLIFISFLLSFHFHLSALSPCSSSSFFHLLRLCLPSSSVFCLSFSLFLLLVYCLSPLLAAASAASQFQFKNPYGHLTEPTILHLPLPIPKLPPYSLLWHVPHLPSGSCVAFRHQRQLKLKSSLSALPVFSLLQIYTSYTPPTRRLVVLN